MNKTVLANVAGMISLLKM